MMCAKQSHLHDNNGCSDNGDISALSYRVGIHTCEIRTYLRTCTMKYT